MENDSSKHKGYEASLVENNHKNNLHYTIGFTNINELSILASCFYTNINKSRLNL